MKIVYSQHLLFRLRIRKISDDLPERILRQADDYFFDRQTNLHIATKHFIIDRKPKIYMVAFTKTESVIKLITVHPIKPNQKSNRIKLKRWEKIKMII